MDGYSTCSELKINQQLSDIPVIFISGNNETFDKVKAFSAGGIDYLTRPFQPEEVLVRVETHLKIRSFRKKLQDSNQELVESLEKQR